MNVEIWTEAAQFSFWEYFFPNFLYSIFAVYFLNDKFGYLYLVLTFFNNIKPCFSDIRS
jgi:hypothetical protein